MKQNVTYSLYQRGGCYFCSRVLRLIDQLDIPVSIRNIWDDEAHLRALTEATGRGTVPVLRIDTSEGETIWLPESAAIIHRLKEYHASLAIDSGQESVG